MPSVWSLLQPVSPPCKLGASRDSAALQAKKPLLETKAPSHFAGSSPFAMPGAWREPPSLGHGLSVAAARTPSPADNAARLASPGRPASGPVLHAPSLRTKDSFEGSEAHRVDPLFVSWLSSLHALPRAVKGARCYLANAALGAAAFGLASSARSEAWRERDELMVQSAWQLEKTLPMTAKVGLVRTMKAGALSSGVYSLVLPWVIFTYPILGLFTPVIVGALFGVSVGIGALAQEWSRKVAVRNDRKSVLPRYDENLRQLVALQLELKELRGGRPLTSRESLALKKAVAEQKELGALSATRPLSASEDKKLKEAIALERELVEQQKGRELDLRETQQLKQLNALRLRYEGGFRNLLRQAIDAVIEGYAVPELHLGTNA